MTITVYAASSGQVPEVYVRAARDLGKAIAAGGHTLVNGAGRTGLMGACTDACLAAGGRAVGVIPEFMIEQGWQHDGMSELIVTHDMHERKERMAALSDACVALPGGVGTLEELLEIITWKQLGLYLKPIIIYNVSGYFDPLLGQLSRATAESFMRPQHQGIWQVADEAHQVVQLAETTPLWDQSVRKYAAL
ncbi:MAG: TIGR00730 family Rossman fold protein [Alloprevotella sp.]|nr:TIGR00730 family Rossman fold protein [Alloprevotella sp.]